MKPQYVSLFSGAGGLDIGLEHVGFVAATQCEIDPVCCQTLTLNQGWPHANQHAYFAQSTILNADIRDLQPRDLFARRSLDLVVGGPPCQAFSSSGKQLSVLDPRGTLVNEFCRLIDGLKPKMFLFENVRGLVTARDQSGQPGGVVKQLIRSLEEPGYSCRAGLLNAADYGSYQRRVRCFILGSRRGLAPPFPEPMYHKEADLFAQPWRTLDEFLRRHADTDESNYCYPTEALRHQLQNIPSGSGLKSAGRAEATRPSGHWGYRQGTFIADLSLPARTVTGSASQDWVRWNGLLRRLTFNEVKLLQGFPSDWVVSGSKSQQFKQIGNAVPSVFGEVLGRVILAHLSQFPSTKPMSIPLPESFHACIEYTKKDHARNHATRTVHRHFESAE